MQTSGLRDRLQNALGATVRIERELDGGGMAHVFVAHQEQPPRDIVVKVLDPGLAHEVDVGRFRREIKVASLLNHPRIVPVIEACESGDLLYYTMPLVRGETLRAVFHRVGPLPVDTAIGYTDDIGAAIAYAHAHNVLHRDIKPENVFVDDGHALVMDFGIARAIEHASDLASVTSRGLTVGTPKYMSPEQAAADKRLDGRSDIYSLACVCYEMLAGEPPFPGTDTRLVLARHMHQEAPAIRVARPDVPPHIEAALLRAMQKSPAARFATVEAFISALHEGPTSVAFVTPVPRRRRMRIAAMVTVVLGISVAALLLARRHSADAEQVPNAAAPDPSRIAVLYPDAPASDTQLVTISRGLARDLIYELERVPGLTLVSTAALGQSTSSIAVDSVIQALRVGTVVTGALERTGGAIRVDMRLVDAGTRAERPVVRVAYAPAMLLDLRDTVVGEVARQLRPEIGRAVRAFEWRARTASTTAWVQRQQAQELIERERAVARVAGNAADPLALLTRADSLLARAVREDPLWAEPLIERGWLRVRRLRYRDRRGYAAEIDSGLAFAALALARDATDARARALRGALRFRRWSDVPGAAPGLLDSAASDLRAATTADPHLARAWNSLSGVLRQQGDMAGAVDAVRQAAGADAYLDEVPESVTRLVFAYLYANRPDSAALVCREWRQRIPRESSLHACELVVLGWSARSMADADRAWVITRDIEGTGVWPLVRGMSPAARYYVAAILARAGRGDSAKSVMRTTRQRLRAAGEPDAALMNEAYALVLLDARDSAVATLQHAVRADTADRARIARSPWFAPLHGDRRYRELVRAP